MPVFVIGEKVWFRKIKENKNAKLGTDVGMAEGIWLGHMRNSNEVVIGTPEGVVRAYDVRPVPEEIKWDAAAVKKIKGTPGKPDPRNLVELRVEGVRSGLAPGRSGRRPRTPWL